MADSDLLPIRVVIAVFVLFWAAAGAWVLVRFGVLAAVLGVGWGGSVLVCSAALAERAVARAVHREQREQVIVLDDPAAA